MTTDQKPFPLRVVVLISGRGSNLEALLAHPGHGQTFQIQAVISNKAGAAGLNTARAHGVACEVLAHADFASREAFDAQLMRLIDSFKPGLVVLAGFMRILTDGFVHHYAGHLVNVHPSLLPAFPGLDTHQRALDAGCCLHGATVHFVTPQLDHGPVIAQAAVPVLAGDTAATLAARVLAREHVILPAAVVAFAHGHLQVDGLRVHWRCEMPPVFTVEVC
jgi:phosphoribosylglycinamide formyltransferase-1